MTIAAPTIRVARWDGLSTWTRFRLTPRWSLARQYLAASLLVVLTGVVITGAWMGHQIESSVLDRTAGITALYIDSVVSPNLQSLAHDESLSASDAAALDHLFSDTGLGQGVVLFKIWSLDGRVVYSPYQAIVGQQFPIDPGLAQASRGEVAADLSYLDEPENAYERERFSRLVEVYAPVREVSGGGRVIAVNEFYLAPDELDAEIRDAQLGSWAVVGAIGLFTYLILSGIVKRGSDTIRRQQAELQRRLDQNVRLHERVRQAAGRTTAWNEQALRRISADLHDGPGQALALALLRLDALQSPCEVGGQCARTREDFATVQSAVRDALTEMRAISAGLRLPQLDSRSVAEVAARAIDDHQRRSRATVERQLVGLPEQAPLAIKIALLRTLQEALSNSARHGRGADVRVKVASDFEALRLTVEDNGPGFDPKQVERSGRLGLSGMRERAELLGGSFEVHSAPGKGTTIRVSWPLTGRAVT